MSGSTIVNVDHDNNNDNKTNALLGDVSTGNGSLQGYGYEEEGGRCLFKRILATAGFSPTEAGVFSPGCRVKIGEVLNLHQDCRNKLRQTLEGGLGS